MAPGMPTVPKLFTTPPTANRQSVKFLLNSPVPERTSSHLGASAVSRGSSRGPDPAAGAARTREGRLLCATCGHDFKDAASLRKHHRVVHLKVKNYECDLCHRRFAEKSNLKKHIVAIHEHGRDHACSQCDKTFSFADGLRRHVNNCHLGLRPHKCAACGASFKQRTHLQKHLASVHAPLPRY